MYHQYTSCIYLHANIFIGRCVMYKIPHIRIPDSLLEDPIFFDALPEHQIIFIRMIRLAAFIPQEHNIRGHIIDLNPGQLCYSYRKLADICGKFITKDHIEGAIKYFQRHDFLLQEVRHKKTIITHTHSDVYALITNTSPTTSPTEVRQQSDINNKSIPNRTKKHVVVVDEKNHVEETSTQKVPKIIDIKEHNIQDQTEKQNNPPETLPKLIQNKEDIPLSIQKHDPKGQVFNASLEEFIHYAVRTRQNWETSEIHEAWKVFCQYEAPISEWIPFISGIINNKRNFKDNKKKEKKWDQPCKQAKKNYSKTKIEDSKKELEKCNDFYLEKDTSESPLAIFARQNGLK